VDEPDWLSALSPRCRLFLRVLGMDLLLLLVVPLGVVVMVVGVESSGRCGKGCGGGSLSCEWRGAPGSASSAALLSKSSVTATSA